jgi:putative transposon-encoded protein
MAQILKLKKKVTKVGNSGRLVLQSTQLKKFVNKEVIVIVTN